MMIEGMICPQQKWPENMKYAQRCTRDCVAFREEDIMLLDGSKPTGEKTQYCLMMREE